MPALESAGWIRAVFWCSASFVVYVYLGYPLLIAVWARLARKRVIGGLEGDSAARSGSTDAACPPVSIVIASRNEAARLPGRIANLLELDYPLDRVQIIVVADGYADAARAALERFEGRIDLVAIPPSGKAAALNAGVARARHDVLVFADARQTFAPAALRALTAPLLDPAVGGVTGELLLGCEGGGRRASADRRNSADAADTQQIGNDPSHRRVGDRRGDLESTAADGVGLYWRYEKWLRRRESQVASTLGATGAIYSLRRSLWRPLPEATILDDVLAPMRAVLAGRRIVFEERAQAFDGTAPDSAAEAKRKVRTLAGNFQILALEPRLLVPLVNPVWVQYVSHKVGRLLVPYALMALMIANVLLASRHVVYAAALAGQCVFYQLAAYGAWLETRSRAATAPAPGQPAMTKESYS